MIPSYYKASEPLSSFQFGDLPPTPQVTFDGTPTDLSDTCWSTFWARHPHEYKGARPGRLGKLVPRSLWHQRQQGSFSAHFRRCFLSFKQISGWCAGTQKCLDHPPWAWKLSERLGLATGEERLGSPQVFEGGVHCSRALADRPVTCLCFVPCAQGMDLCPNSKARGLLLCSQQWPCSTSRSSPTPAASAPC